MTLPVVNLLVWCCSLRPVVACLIPVWFLNVLAQVCYFSSSSMALICFGVKKSTRNSASTQCDALSSISNKKTVTFLSDFPCSITELNLALKQLLDLYPEERLWDTDLIVRNALWSFSQRFSGSPNLKLNYTRLSWTSRSPVWASAPQVWVWKISTASCWALLDRNWKIWGS